MGIVFPLIYLDNPSGDAQRDGLDSSYNFSNAMASLALVEDLLADEVFPRKEMVILTPYQAQWMRYLDYLDRLRKKRPDLRVADVFVFKADSFQGQRPRLLSWTSWSPQRPGSWDKRID